MVEIVRPDPATEAREMARKQARMDAIAAYSERGGNGVDFRTHTRKIMDQYRNELRRVREDIRIPNDAARHQELMRVGREYRQAFEEARAEATRALEVEKSRLELRANPAPVRGRHSTQELLEMQMLRDDLERRWSRTEGIDVLDGYRRALRSGDTMAAEVYEQYGGEFIKDHALRSEFADLTYEVQRERLPASTRQALSEYEGLLAEESAIMLGMSHQANLVGLDVQIARDAAPILTRDDVYPDRKPQGGDRDDS